MIRLLTAEITSLLTCSDLPESPNLLVRLLKQAGQRACDTRYSSPTALFQPDTARPTQLLVSFLRTTYNAAKARPRTSRPSPTLQKFAVQCLPTPPKRPASTHSPSQASMHPRRDPQLIPTTLLPLLQSSQLRNHHAPYVLPR